MCDVEDIEGQEGKTMKQQPPQQPVLVGRGSVFEYSMYGLVVGACFLILVQRGIEFSNACSPGGIWEGRAPKLEKGWIFGRRVDLSDNQWRSFRSMIPALSLVFLIGGLVSRILERKYILRKGCMYRMYYIVVWACTMVLLVHGGRGLYVILLVSLNWIWTRMLVSLPLSSRQKIWSVWILHCGVLLSVRMSGGFRLLDDILSLVWTTKEMFRWEICYNLTMLRMISYSLDCIKASEKSQERVSSRIAASLPSMDFYGYLYSIAHALYPPLYIAGPIVTYNDFVRQLMHIGDDQRGRDEKNAKVYTAPPDMRTVLVYAGRCIVDLAVIELMTHYFYFNRFKHFINCYG